MWRAMRLFLFDVTRDLWFSASHTDSRPVAPFMLTFPVGTAADSLRNTLDFQ